MEKFIKNKFVKEFLVGVGAVIFVVLMTIFAVKKIHQREDLALLQIDFTDTIVEAKLCLENKGIVQDPSQGRQGKVFICSKQNIVKNTFPVLQKLSRRGFKYRYLSSKKCLPADEAGLPSRQIGFNRGCDNDDGDDKNNDEVKRINIGRGNKLVLSCDVIEGVCSVR